MTPGAFGLDADEVRRMIAAVAPTPEAADDWRDRFARAAWTTLAEPGDAVAGALVGAIGAPAALELVIADAGGRAPAARSSMLGAEGGPERAALEAGLRRWAPRVSAVAVVRSLEQAARFGHRFSTPEDAWWPRGLADLGPSAPIALWTRGDATRLAGATSGAAIVGARAATGYGERVAIELAAGIGHRGLAIVSGGAYGIDAAAHRAALTGGAPTIVVLAGGLDRAYPVGHGELFDRIAVDGVLVAEVPCGVPPTRWRFLQRNRLIAAATAATIVVEAGHRSGSLNTAGHPARV